MHRLAIMYNNFGPYHLARLQTAALLGKEREVEVVGLELASHEAIRAWRIDNPQEVELITVFPEKVVEDIPSLELARGTWTALQKLNPQVVALGLSKETLPAMLTVLAWKRLRRRVAVILMDSKYDDCPRPPWKEWFKKRIFHGFDAALVGGVHSRQYAKMLGIPQQNIFVGCDVVDNEFFARRARRARENAASLRALRGLTEDYFLYVGRFDDKKNVSGLLKAYSRYVQKSPVGQAWLLVLCGSGPLEDRLRQEARQLGLAQVIFAGFQQIDELPLYYGLARCLIMHSLGDTWGLVVNEAMASGLPALVSRACGCAPDLVQEGVNGFTFDPYDLEGLAQLMGRIASGAVDLAAMGEASRRLIADWSLETYARNLLKAVEVAMSP